MMKSFFKKLAFVMALAMVVTMAAPAAQASAADALGIALQDAKSKDEVITADNIAIDETEDYKYYGAVKEYLSLHPTWESKNPEVASVTQKGEVTGLKDGVATITISLDNGQVGEIEITVGKGAEASKEFEVKQLTATKLQLTFADKASATKDVTVEKVVKTADGYKNMVWVLNTNKTALKDNVVTIEPWVAFGNGTYEVTANGVTVEVTTAVGDPAEAEISYAKPYTYAEAGAPAAVTLKVTDANGVEVAKTAYTAYYELVAAEPAGYAYVNGTNGELYFYTDNAVAVVKVTVQYTVGNDLKTFSVTKEVKSEKKPVVSIIPALDSVAVVGSAAKADEIAWGSSDVKIGDGTYYVAGLIKDTADASFAINTISKGSKDWNKNVVTGYKFTYESTDTSKVLVDKTTGALIGVNTTDTPAYVLVTMWKTEAGKADVEIGIVAAAAVNVQAKKAASYVTLGTDNFAVLLTTGDYKTKTVTPKTYNQYNEEYKDAEGNTDTIKSVTAVFNNLTHNATISTDKKSFTVNAADADAILNAGTIKSTQFTYKVTMASGKTTDFTLTIKTVPGAQNEVYKLDVAGATIKVDDLSKAVKVAVVSEVLGEKFENEKFYYGKVDASVATTGSLYVVVLDKDLKPITPATTAALVSNKTTPAVTKNVTGSAIETLAAGAYAVQLYKVIDIVNGVVVDTMIDSVVYTVDNQLPTVATDVTVDIDKKLVASGKTVYLVADAVKFKVNGEENNGTTTGKFTIGAVNAVKVSNDKTFVYDFKVQYKVGNGYVEITVPVNKTFNLQ